MVLYIPSHMGLELQGYVRPGSTRITYQSWQRSLPPFGGDLAIDTSIFLHVNKDW